MLPSLRSRRSAEVPSLFDSLWTDMDSFFNDTVQYTSDQGNLVIEIEAPGFNKDNISVEVFDGIVTVKGDRKISEGTSHIGTKTLYKRMKISQSEEIDASIQDGILRLVVKQPKKESTKIELK